jgi:hypothetical protein
MSPTFWADAIPLSKKTANNTQRGVFTEAEMRESHGKIPYGDLSGRLRFLGGIEVEIANLVPI